MSPVLLTHFTDGKTIWSVDLKNRNHPLRLFSCHILAAVFGVTLGIQGV